RHVGGVFLTTDPLGYVDGPNLYQFALNNPVNYSDPMGLYVGETDPNKLKAQQLQIRLTGLRSEIARRAAAVEKRAHLNMLRQNLVDQVHPDEWVYTLAEWSHAAGMNLQDRAALQRAVFGPLGNCQTSMEQFTCAGASYTAGVGEIMDISLEIVLAVVPTVSISGAGGGIARGGINVAGHRSSLQALGRAARRDLYGRVPQTLSRSQQAFQKQLAFGRAKGIYPSGNDIALGVDDFLSDFAFQNNAWHWKYWEKVQLADRFADTGSGFELMFRQATMRTPRIHFNLQGMGNIRAAYQRGLLGVTKAPNNYTNAELAWILNDPDLLAKTTFHLNGRTVSGSLIHQLARP
ncbi:MAG: hypothetical protein MPN21_27020, partial [Thermoanaerobaculia bacterium]|nr:hypothetical protein [Thermoanaerobaculia bacterium]